jgi:hypothetical protein
MMALKQAYAEKIDLASFDTALVIAACPGFARDETKDGEASEIGC